MKTDNFESKGQKEKRREREEHFLLERGGFVCWVDRDQMNELINPMCSSMDFSPSNTDRIRLYR